MALQEVGEVGPLGDPDHPVLGVAQDAGEDVEDLTGAIRVGHPLVPPVHLGLGPRDGLEAHQGPPAGGGPLLADVELHGLVTARVPLGLQFPEEPGRRDPGGPLELPVEGGLPGVELLGAGSALVAGRHAALDRSADGPPVPAGPAGDLGAGEPLAVHQLDVHPLLPSDHRVSSTGGFRQRVPGVEGGRTDIFTSSDHRHLYLTSYTCAKASARSFAEPQAEVTLTSVSADSCSR